MRRVFGAAAVSAAMLFVTADAQPPAGGKKGPPRFELGKVLPPFAREAIDLTPEQAERIAALEKDVKAKLDAILTAAQKKALADFRPGADGKGGPPAGGPKKGPPAAGEKKGESASPGGVQWFATWEAGKAEAARTGRPILFVSAAPHCGGVSGVW